MCRIAGIVSHNEKIDFNEQLGAMLHCMNHGGQDGEGSYVDEKVAIGHRRLAIIELSNAGHQPMVSHSQDAILAFNGEIYNYEHLRKELILHGVVFQTKTDTEVILQSYLYWGTKSFDKLEGIFAFVLYDKATKKIFLVRDQIGVKPMYYFKDNQGFIFASEVRAFSALKREWKESEDWKVLFLAFGSMPQPYTTLQGVYQLPPGAFLELNVDDFSFEIQQYYYERKPDISINSKAEALSAMQKSVNEALNKNLIADAPLGIFLSGGIDSSLLTLLADPQKQELKTISVNFDESTFDEYPYQKIVLERSKHLNHTSHRVTEQMFWDNLNDIWQAMDQPSLDGVNTYFIAQCARKDGLKAVLSGVGADEIFGGYISFKRITWLKRLRRIPLKRQIVNIAKYIKLAYKRIMFLELEGPVGDYLFLRGIFTPDSIALVLKIPEKTVWEILKKVKIVVPYPMTDSEYNSFLETNVYLTNQLLKDADAMGMWHGVEIRVPFLDSELVKKVKTIQPYLRFNAKWPKYLLTATFKDLIPHKIIFRKKRGFTFPFPIWMKRSQKRFQDLMSSSQIEKRVYAEFVHNRSHWSKPWSLLVLNNFSKEIQGNKSQNNISDKDKARSINLANINTAKTILRKAL